MNRDDVLNALTDKGVLSRFVSVGLLGAVVENSFLFIAVQFGGLPALIGAAIGKELAILSMFAINDEWTFDDAAGTDDSMLQRLAESHTVRLLGVVVSLSTLHVLITYFGVWFLAANIIGIGAGFMVNYTLENVVTWETHKDDE